MVNFAMDISVFKTLAENARKVKWSDTALFDNVKVKVTDVDLVGKPSPPATPESFGHDICRAPAWPVGKDW